MACNEPTHGGFRSAGKAGEGQLTPVGDTVPGTRIRQWSPPRRTHPRTVLASGGERSGRTMPILTAAPAPSSRAVPPGLLR